MPRRFCNVVVANVPLKIMRVARQQISQAAKIPVLIFPRLAQGLFAASVIASGASIMN
jgi:hypothetical protein